MKPLIFLKLANIFLISQIVRYFRSPTYIRTTSALKVWNLIKYLKLRIFQRHPLVIVESQLKEKWAFILKLQLYVISSKLSTSSTNYKWCLQWRSLQTMLPMAWLLLILWHSNIFRDTCAWSCVYFKRSHFCQQTSAGIFSSHPRKNPCLNICW